LTQIPKLIKNVKDVLHIENEDMIICILRHYQWNQQKVEEHYFEEADSIQKELGIVDMKVIRK
jgi:hypothetical protein